MTANGRDDPATPDTPLYGDAEAQAASGVALPSLRVLQAAGAIRAEKVAKYHGGFRRMWPEPEVLKAAVAAVMGEHFAWNIRTVAEAMAKTRAGTWDALTVMASARHEADATEKPLIRVTDQDWRLELIDRKFLFLRVPEPMRTMLAGMDHRASALLLGVAHPEEGFQTIPWGLGSPSGRRKLTKALGAETVKTIEPVYKLSLVAADNFLSKTTINVSMQVQRARHRLRGREPRFIQEAVNLGKRRA